MAYAALLSLAQTLDLLLYNDQCRVLIKRQPKIVEIIESVKEKVSFLKLFLNDYPPPKLTLDLEGGIRDSAHQMEDIIHNFISFERVFNVEKIMDLLKFCLPCHKQPPSLNQLCWDLQEASQKLDLVLEDVNNINIRPQLANSTQTTLQAFSAAAASGGSSRHSGKGAMVGFEDEVREVLMRLCGESSKREIIPIVGMGGSGKTTLARHIYDGQLCAERFDFRAWVTISQEYGVQDILMKLFPFDGQSNNSDVESLMTQLYQSLKGRRYLIILDDIWDGEAWDAVRRAFPDDNNGSRIILTTREIGVAEYADSSAPLHQMNLLDNDQSWDLLCKNVFAEESCPSELEEMGRVVSGNCKGLPLAIVVIAGVLSVNRTIDHWKHVAENMMASLSNSEGDIFELLSLSYNHLPNYLKPCFLYLGVFPEDYEIDVSMLVRLWVAEGFIEPNVERDPEDIAKGFLKDLVKRNLVFVKLKTYIRRKRKSCGIHDVLREWCIRRAAEEHFYIHLTDYHDKIQEAALNQRRICTHMCTMESRSEKINGSQVRTVLFFGRDLKLGRYIRSFRLIRVLETESTHTRIDGQFKLIHLKYLSLFIDGDKEFKLPRSISNLYNLQTLILKSFGKRIRLPIEIWGMHQLRHLVFPYGTSLPAPPTSGIINGRKTCFLPNLQTISSPKNLTCSTENLNMMPNLKELELSYFCSLSEMEEAVSRLKNLVVLTKLTTLYLGIQVKKDKNFCWEWNPTGLSKILAFPSTLTSLRLRNCRFPCETMTIIGSLPNLKLLELQSDSVRGEEWETREGEFLRLEVLIMKSLGLRRWIVADNTHFPSLVYLRLQQCYKLEEIPDCIGEIPTLQRIEVNEFNQSVLASARKIQEEQQSFGNTLLRVDVDW